MFELVAFFYVAALIACFLGAAQFPRYRGALIALGAVLTVPAILFGAWIALLLIALSQGGIHFG